MDTTKVPTTTAIEWTQLLADLITKYLDSPNIMYPLMQSIVGVLMDDWKCVEAKDLHGPVTPCMCEIRQYLIPPAIAADINRPEMSAVWSKLRRQWAAWFQKRALPRGMARREAPGESRDQDLRAIVKWRIPVLCREEDVAFGKAFIVYSACPHLRLLPIQWEMLLAQVRPQPIRELHPSNFVMQRDQSVLGGFYELNTALSSGPSFLPRERPVRQ
ncbi:hypothetical protein M011DRAFT_476298 [Sporormia fimetaria CBS 119925]|uniref:Uncharacterized protein n=1 Tax=Sporormia fimetaria CBS 119925 TaxID=1340428 RepID=A0A6A6VGF5_9PLEO|nr:hypothetical protein M011DRAFT_476298 [Sporormia fimetaria CBS 119925]